VTCRLLTARRPTESSALAFGDRVRTCGDGKVIAPALRKAAPVAWTGSAALSAAATSVAALSSANETETTRPASALKV